MSNSKEPDLSELEIGHPALSAFTSVGALLGAVATVAPLLFAWGVASCFGYLYAFGSEHLLGEVPTTTILASGGLVTVVVVMASLVAICALPKTKDTFRLLLAMASWSLGIAVLGITFLGFARGEWSLELLTVIALGTAALAICALSAFQAAELAHHRFQESTTKWLTPIALVLMVSVFGAGFALVSSFAYGTLAQLADTACIFEANGDRWTLVFVGNSQAYACKECPTGNGKQHRVFTLDAIDVVSRP